MAGLLSIKCLGYLLLWSAVVQVSPIVQCQNDCGYTLEWTPWDCDHCAANNNIATRVRGLCCKQETKDNCLRRCHKTDSDISNKRSCSLVCHQPSPLTPFLGATASTTSAAHVVPVTGAIAGNPTTATLVPAHGAIAGNPAPTTLVQALGAIAGNPTPAKLVPALGATTITPSPAVTVTTSAKSTTLGPGPAVLSTSSPTPSAIVSSSALNAIQPTNVGASPGMPVASTPSSPGPSYLTSTESATLGQYPSSSNTNGTTPNDNNNNSGLCPWLCERLKGRGRCADECTKPEAGNVCTILAVSLFFSGIVIGAMLMAAITRCCCHSKVLAQKHGSAKHRKTIMVGQYDSRDPTHSDVDVIRTPQKEKRELIRVMELSKNRRQVSPFSSSANLVDSDWLLGDDSPRVPTQRFQSSIAATNHVTEQCENKSAKPTFFVGTTRPFSGVMRTPGAFGGGNVVTNGTGLVKPRGNVWLTD